MLKLSLLVEIRKLLEDEDDLCEVQTETVPNEVREWLASTFTKSNAQKKRTEDKPKFRSVANAIRAGIMVDRYDFVIENLLMIVCLPTEFIEDYQIQCFYKLLLKLLAF